MDMNSTKRKKEKINVFGFVDDDLLISKYHVC